MVSSPSAQDVKRARKESLFFRTISSLLMQLAQDEPNLLGLVVSRVALSHSYSSCTVFIYPPGGQQEFDEKLQLLKLYKPSIRKSISSLIPGRYTPEIIFKYDNQYEKQRKLDELLASLSEEDAS